MFDSNSTDGVDPTWLKLLKDVLLPLATLFVGLFAQKIIDAIYRPHIFLSFDGKSEDCVSDTDDEREHKNGKLVRHQAKYVRVRVRNLKRTTARRCRAYLVRIEELKQGMFVDTKYCDTIPLSWATRQSRIVKEAEYEPIDLPIGVNQFIDVVSIIDDGWKQIKNCKSPLESKTKIRIFRYEPIFSSRGTFRYTVMVAGDNFLPKTLSIVLSWDGPKAKFPYNFHAV